MFDFTDLITFFLSIFLVFRGYFRGLLHSLIGPFSIIVTTILSVIYYQQTKDMVVSFAIGLVGPFILHFVLKILVKKWTSIQTPGLLSRIAGSFLTLAWGWCWIFMLLIPLALIPSLGKPWKLVHDDVVRSKSYSYIKPLQDLFFPMPKLKPASDTIQVSNTDVQSLAQDPRFQQVLQDPEVQTEIKAHDIAKLIRNPKIMQLTGQMMNDPALLKKMMLIYNAQMAQVQQSASSTTAASQPSQ